jgi:hypothetical protein
MELPLDALEAIEAMIDCNIHGYSRKQIACMLRPKLSMPAAKSWLSKCLDPLGDQNFHPNDVDQICEITGRTDIYINYFADKHGWERTGRRVKLDARNEVILLRQALKEHGLDPDEALSDYLEEHKDLFAITFKKEKKGR